MSTPDGLPPLREVIRAAGLTAKKSLGQNFLLDFNLTRRIARAAGPLDGVTIVEVGPGPGGLTRALLIEGRGARRRHREGPALPARARRHRCALSGPARHRRGRRARSRLCGSRAPLARPHRRQPALQRRHPSPHLLAEDRALAALVRPARADVPARIRRPHRGRRRAARITDGLPCFRNGARRPAFSLRFRLPPSRQGRRSIPRWSSSSRARLPPRLATCPCWRRSPPRPSARGGRCCARRCGRSRPTARLCSSDSASTLKRAPKSLAVGDFCRIANALAAERR